jgi:sugar/nucleoside kinase (ribokinase family)
MLDVVGIGENSVDLVYRLAGPPAANTKIPVLAHSVLTGGQVATTLCTCASLGLRTSYVGSFGGDSHGRVIRDALESRGIDTSHAPARDAPNRYAVILIDSRTGERTILWQRDPALVLRPEDLPVDLIAGARLLHVDTVDEAAAIAAARMARAAGRHVTTDIDTVTPRTAELVALATVPIFAADVPAALTGESDPERALRALRRNHDGLLCVTLGAGGSMLLAGDRLHHAPAFTVETVDTTGAGDVFRGALIYALLRGDDPTSMLRFANAAAAISCTREGAIGGVPTLAEVEALLNDEGITTHRGTEALRVDKDPGS